MPERDFAESLYYCCSREFLEAGKKRPASNTARQATSNEVKALLTEARNLKETLAKEMLEKRLLQSCPDTEIGRLHQTQNLQFFECLFWAQAGLLTCQPTFLLH